MAKSREYTIAANTRGTASSFEHFQIATCFIGEGNRIAAAFHLKAAIRSIDKSTRPDFDMRADLAALLATVERNAEAV